MKKFALYVFLSAIAFALHAQQFSVLKDIKPGNASSFSGGLMLAGNKLFFSADDGIHGTELWMSDGTTNTTVLALDLVSGSGSSFPQNMIFMNGSLYFTATDGVSGKELWKMDISTMALLRLTNTSSSSPFGFEDPFFVFNNKLYFAFDDGIHGSEAWKTDGTIAGTVLVKDLRTGAVSTNPRKFFVFQNKLYYLGEDDIDTQALYVIDDVAGTNARFFNCGEGGCSAFTVFNNALYFFSDDQTFSSPDNELYTSDGSTQGTHIVKQINPNSVGTYFGAIAVANNLMVFCSR